LDVQCHECFADGVKFRLDGMKCENAVLTSHY